MDRVVAARKLIGELVKAEEIEVRRAEIVGRDLAKLVETLGRPPSGRELDDFLGDHTQVAELYASTNRLEDLIHLYLTPAVDPAPLADVRHPELERQLRDWPDTPEPYLVYSDWLQEQGDPMGELIALGVKATSGGDDDRARFERFLELHRARFLGGLTKQQLAGLELHWRYGLVHEIEPRVTLDRPTPDVWQQLLALRVCEAAQKIGLGWNATPEVVAAVCAMPALRALSIVSGDAGLPPELRATRLSSLAIHTSSVGITGDDLPPTLEHLELTVGKLIAPARLDLRGLATRLTPSIAEWLAIVQLPRLERLTLSLDGESAAGVPALLGERALPALQHLEIREGTLDAKTFAKLGALPLASQLRSLSLTLLELTDDKAAAMAKTTGFTALAELDLSYNELTRDGLDAVRVLAPSVISRRQARPGHAAERRIRRFAGSRFAVAEDIADPKAWKRARVDGALRWARYQGNDEYELFVDAELARYGCTCPSSIQPCKHVVALALVAERMPLAEAPAGDIEDRVRRTRTFVPVSE